MKRFSVLVAAAMVAVAMWLGAPNGALAQNQPDFGQVRAAVPACANLPGPTSGTATCAQWSALTFCIVQNAATSITCSADMAEGARALAAMQATCDASHAAEVARLQGQLASCRSARPAPTSSRRLTAPRCLAETGAALVCRDRRGNWHRESSETHACTAHVGNMTQFACACPAGSPGAARIAYRNGRRAANTYACMTGTAAAPVAPVVTERTEAQVQQAEAADLRGLAAVRNRIDHACTNTAVAITRNAQGALVFSLSSEAVAPATSDLAPPPNADHNCANFSTLINEVFRRVLIAGASPTVTPADLIEVNRRLGVHDEQIAELRSGRVQDRAAHQAVVRRVGALERRRSSNGWQINLSTGVSGGWTSLSDLGGASVFSETAVNFRYWFGHRFGLQASGTVLFGALGAPGINNVGGYMAQAGASIHVAPSESISLVFDLGAYVRTYALTGFEQVGNLADARMIGDYAGRTVGGQFAATVSFAHGLVAVQARLAAGYGEGVYATPFRNTINVQTGDGPEFLPGVFVTIGLGEPPPAVAPDPEPVAAAAPVSTPAPVTATPVTPVVTAPAPQPTPPPAAAAVTPSDEVPFLEGVDS